MTSRRPLPAPRWQTPLPAGTVHSWGPDVAAWATTELRIDLDRWQTRALNRALAVHPATYAGGAWWTGRLVHRLYLVSTGRQNGKTVIVRALIGWALTARRTPAWARVLGLAHDAKQARIPYDAVRIDLEPIRRRWPNGGLALTRYLGIRSDLYGRHREYDIGSRESRNAIRGTTNDLGVFDEVRTQLNYETWAALEPTTTARPDPLILGLSTAGDDRSVLLNDWFERGRRIIDGAEPSAGFGMTWYAAGDDDDPADPRAWAKANPAIAEGRIDPRVIGDSRLTLSAGAFRSERLNLRTEGGVDELLPPGLWPARGAPQPADAQRIVFGVEAVPGWRRASVVVAILTDAGAWVGMAGELDSSRTSSLSIAPAQLVALVDRLARAWRPTAVAWSASAAVSRDLVAWAEGRPGPNVGLALNARQVRSASELWRSELVGGRLTHGDDPLLAQQVRVARARGDVASGDWFLSTVESLGEIDAVRASAWAVWAAIAPEAREVPPQVFL